MSNQSAGNTLLIQRLTDDREKELTEKLARFEDLRPSEYLFLIHLYLLRLDCSIVHLNLLCRLLKSFT